MEFKLTVEMENAAFEDGHHGAAELRRILDDVSERIKDFDGRADRGVVHDAGGNSVGTWRIG